MVLSSSLLFLFTGCNTGSHPGSEYALADKIELTWELTGNNIDGHNRFQAAFTLANKGDQPLGNSGWSLYFNYRHIVIESTVSETANIRFINGDFYELSPTDSFVLAPGQSMTIEYEGSGRMIKNDRAPAGLYFVFTGQDGQEAIASISNYFAIPIDPGQVGQNVPTSGSRFRDNTNLRKLTKDELIPVVPTPREAHYTGETVSLDSDFRIHYQEGLDTEALFLARALEKILSRAPVVSKTMAGGSGVIALKAERQDKIGSSEETYQLDIATDRGITIHGNGAAGVFYGIQSLLALFPPEVFQRPQSSVLLPTLSIKDAPRFSYRGMHLDVSRNFSRKEAVFKLLDIMAFYKLNKFHFHLTDDEGWRLQIKGLPELTDIGAFRGHTLDDSRHLQPAYGSGPFPDSASSYGSGYYTREDYKEIIRYARDRHIEVIPEFDFPGHARAAIKAMEARYSRLMAEGREDEAKEYLLADRDDESEYASAQRYWDNVVSVCSESTYRFYEAVIDDVIAMHREGGVPLHTIHMGGDEVPDGSWEKSPVCAQFIQESDLVDDYRDLETYFLNRLQRIHEDRGLNIAGWQEIGIVQDERGEHQPKPEFAGQNVVIYSWDNFRPMNFDIGYKMANAGYPVVLCNSTNLYLELAYDNDPAEPGDYFAGFVSTQKVYEFMPVNFLAAIEQRSSRELVPLDPDAHDNIVGMQGHLWSEPIVGPDSLEYFYAPELLALAERSWAPRPAWETMGEGAGREKALTEAWNVFANTLGQRELPRLDGLFGGFNYRIPLPGAVIADDMLHANVAFPGLTIRYTTDGSDPSQNSEIYAGPVHAEGDVRLRTFDTRGRGSRISTISE